jgi:four helix bundle protein
MSMQTGYRTLSVFQKANGLVLGIYKTTKQFPRDEMFGLTSQMRRCAVSVPANIVEGYTRRTNKDKLQFYFIAKSSLRELEYYIDLAKELGYIDTQQHESLVGMHSEVGKLLTGFIQYYYT